MAGLDLFQQDVNTGASRLSVRPIQEMAIIKHDARSGALSVIVPDNDPNDNTSQGSIVDVKKLEFVPITRTLIAKGENIGSNVTIAGHFDIYSYVKNTSVSLGLFGRQSMYDGTDKRASVQNRLYGLIRTVDGEPVAKLGEDNALAQKFGSNPVPAFFDLNHTKFQALEAVTDVNKPMYLTISGGKGTKTNPLSYKTSYATNYKPKFEAKDMPAEAQEKMAEFASDFVNETSKWVAEVRANDAFLSLLAENELVMPDVVNTLNNSFSIGTVEQFEAKAEKLGDGDVEAGTAILVKKVLAKIGSDAGEFESDTDEETGFVGDKPATEATDSPFKGGAEVDVADDDLPF